MKACVRGMISTKPSIVDDVMTAVALGWAVRKTSIDLY
jgi:hypothetical protein